MRVVVIGGGIIGASIAFHVKGFASDVVLYEAQTLASGATGRSSALVRCHHTYLPDAVLAQQGCYAYRNWREMVGGDVGFCQTGFVRIVSPHHRKKLKKNVQRLQSIGVMTEVIDASTLKALYPRVNTDDFDVAAYEPLGGYADPHRATMSYLAQGIRVHTGSPVTTMTLGNDGWHIGNEIMPFDVAILANGAGANTLLKAIGLNPLPLASRTHFVGVLEGLSGTDYPTCIDGLRDVYFRSDGRQFLFGPRTLAEEEGFGFMPFAAIERGIQAVVGRIPESVHWRFLRGYTGIDTHTPDGHAIIDQIAPNCYVALGFSGTGFKMAPAVGEYLAQWISTGTCPQELTTYRADRFRLNQPIRDPDAYHDRGYEPPLEGASDSNAEGRW